MKKNDLIELEITGYAFEGKGIAKIDVGTPDESENSSKKFVVFVNGSYPGDIVKAQIRKLKRTFAEAKAIEVLKPSLSRISPRCKYFGTCGGCKQQDLDYKTQLKYKEEQVYDIFERLGGLTNFESLPIIPSEKKFFYRNKMEYSFSDKRWLTPGELISENKIIDKNFALGLHIPRIFDKVLDIDECFLQSELSNKVLNFSREFFKTRNISIYSTKTHIGFLRNLVIKTSHHTSDLMVNLVTSEEDDKLLSEYSKLLKSEVPEVTTILNNVNLKKSQVAIGDYEKVYEGNDYIYDSIGKYRFRISANSFFQTNTLQAENLYRTALDFANFQGNEIVYDLYSGAGTISIFVAESVKQVIGIESVDSSVSDAKVNAKLNNIKNLRFIKADLNKSFVPIIRGKNLPQADCIITDPPRSGMNPKTVKDLLQIKPYKIVYVSCNPTTQARDIKMLTEGGYKLIKVQPVDMFPHTYHIENVALLKLN